VVTVGALISDQRFASGLWILSGRTEGRDARQAPEQLRDHRALRASLSPFCGSSDEAIFGLDASATSTPFHHADGAAALLAGGTSLGTPWLSRRTHGSLLGIAGLRKAQASPLEPGSRIHRFFNSIQDQFVRKWTNQSNTK
jgi:hypothetical protein